MTDQIPADKVRPILDEWERIKEYADWVDMDNLVQSLRALLPAPTLADMTEEERSACQWMQADTEKWGRAIITTADWVDGHAELIDRQGDVSCEAHAYITPRPDLPRFVWPGDGVEDIPIVEEVIPGVVVGQPITNPDVMLGISIYAPDGTVVVGRAPDCHPKASVKSGGPWQSVTGMRVHLYHALGVLDYAELESVTVVRWGKETNK